MYVKLCHISLIAHSSTPDRRRDAGSVGVSLLCIQNAVQGNKRLADVSCEVRRCNVSIPHHSGFIRVRNVAKCH